MKKYIEKGNIQNEHSDYIWPISRSVTPDEMNTSFGPRINSNEWQFHRGMDLPVTELTPVYAITSGSIYLAGDGNDSFESRHVVIKVTPNSKNKRALFLIYLHLSQIGKYIEEGVEVGKGDYIGNVGSDKVPYHYLHIEFREANNKGKLDNRRIKHPLNYLPYIDTVNFNGKLRAKYQKSGPTTIKARLSFVGIDKNEGDLRAVEVSIYRNNSIITEPKIVDFEKAATIDKSGDNNDNLIFNNKDIGIEGYQTSNMGSKRYNDLHYGILIRNIADDCDKLSAKVIDIGGNVTESLDITILQLSSFEQSLNFEDGLIPPSGWRVAKSRTESNDENYSTVLQVSNEITSAHSGNRGMLCRVGKFTGSGLHAAIEYTLPYNEYFELSLKATINPYELELADGGSIYPFYFLDEHNLSVAAGIYTEKNIFQTRLAVKEPDGKIRHSAINANNNQINIQEWRRWKLVLRRVDTRETTAAIYLADENNTALSKVATIRYDSRTYSPKKLRIGIGFCSPNASGTILMDNVKLSGRV